MVVAARPIASPSVAPVPAPSRYAGVFEPLPELERQVLKLPSLYSYLQLVPDPRDRQGRGIRHPLPALLALICLAWLSGIRGYRPAAEWAAAFPVEDRMALGFTRPEAPAGSTLFEVLKALSWEALETQLRAWLVAAEEYVQAVERSRPPASKAPADSSAAAPFRGDPSALALDGKALRGSWKRGAKVAGLLAVVTHRLALTVAHTPLSTKEGELTGVRPLLKILTLDSMVVTIDAQYTQPDIATTICERGGEYVMRVKGNQPQLLSDIQALLGPEHFDAQRRQSFRTQGKKAHGRTENRLLIAQQLTAAEAADLDWPQAQQVFVVISQQQRGPKLTQETRIYGITSLAASEADAERLLRLYRGHWTVENRGFWVRDVVLGEDASTVTNGNNVAVLASLRGAVLNLLRLTGEPSVARTIRKMNANRADGLRLIGCL